MRADKIKLSDSLVKSKDMKSEARTLTDKVHSLKGINAVRVDPMENTITVDYNENQVSLSDIKKVLKEDNYI